MSDSTFTNINPNGDSLNHEKLLEAKKDLMKFALGLPKEFFPQIDLTDTITKIKMLYGLNIVAPSFHGLLVTAAPTYSPSYLYFTVRPRIAQWRRNQLLCKIAHTPKKKRENK